MTRNIYLLEALAEKCGELTLTASKLRTMYSVNLSNNDLASKLCIEFIHVFTIMNMMDDLFDESTKDIIDDPEKVKADYQAQLEEKMKNVGV